MKTSAIATRPEGLSSAALGPQTLFVAPNGDDKQGDGSMERPFANIEHAIEIAAANGMDGGDQVFLRTVPTARSRRSGSRSTAVRAAGPAWWSR